jgi:hypothetical protein
MTADRWPAWQDIATAPRDGTKVWLRLASGCELPASWMGGFETETGETGAWCAWSENMIPPSWTDAVCWTVNEAGVASDQPVAWMPPHDPR